jgi:hypothetical protein
LKEIKMAHTIFIDADAGVWVNDQLRKRPGCFNQFSETQMITRSRHTGWWIVQELNTVYGYWATARGGKPGTQYALPQDEVDRLLDLPAFTGPLHPADEKFRRNATCG